MARQRRMALLEESNPLRGLRTDGVGEAERLRSGRRTAVAALVASVLWGFGFLSLVGVLTGVGAWVYLRSADDRPIYRNLALAAIVLGAAGLVATAVWAF